MRIGAGLDNYNKRMDVAIKYFPKNKELAIPMIQDAVNIYNQISKSNIDASQITNEIEAKELRDKIADDGVTQLYKQAMSNPTPNNVSLFEVAKQKAYQGGISKGTYDGLKVEVKKEGTLTDVQKYENEVKLKGIPQAVATKPGEGQVTLSPGQTRVDASGKEIATGGEVDKKPKELESLKSDYMQTMGRYWSAKRGEGQFIEDPNAQQVAKEALKAAVTMAAKYKEMGGDVKDLGIDEKALEEKGTKEKTDTKEMVEMPPPEEHKGKVLKDTVTGKRFRSNGKEWIEIK
jgi:hypothetical protein